MRTQIPQSRICKKRDDVFALVLGTLGELGGGINGGQIVFEGTPEQILQCKNSKIGMWLGKMCGTNT